MRTGINTTAGEAREEGSRGRNNGLIYKQIPVIRVISPDLTTARGTSAEYDTNLLEMAKQPTSLIERVGATMALRGVRYLPSRAENTADVSLPARDDSAGCSAEDGGGEHVDRLRFRGRAAWRNFHSLKLDGA